MDTKPRQRKTVTRRKRVRLPDIYHPEEVTKYSCTMPIFCSVSLLFNN